MAASLTRSVANTIRLLRLSPFDTASEEGRSLERNRRIAWTSVSAATAKGAAAFSMLVSIPITLGYLGPERFGLWMAVSAGIAMLHFADLGLSNGLMNAVARAKGEDAPDELRSVANNGLFALILVAVLLAGVFSLVFPVIPWADLFNASAPLARAEAGPLVLVLMGCFVLNLPLAAAGRIQFGLQRGYLANAWEALGSLLGLAGVVCAVTLEAGLAWLALSMAGIPVLARGANATIFLWRQMPSLRPHWTGIRGSVIRRLLRTGSLFFVLQLAVIIGVQSDNLIIASLVGPAAVAGYDIAFKLALLPSMFIGFVVIAQWPAYGEAQARGDSLWIRKTFLRTLSTALALSAVYAFCLALFGKGIVEVWAGPAVIPSTVLLYGMCTWSVLAVVGAVVSALLNGMHIVTFQVVTATLFAAVNVALSILLVRRFGAVGAIYGSIIAFTACTLVPYVARVPRLLQSAPVSLRGSSTA